jgi:hypothetical protein
MDVVKGDLKINSTHTWSRLRLDIDGLITSNIYNILHGYFGKMSWWTSEIVPSGITLEIMYIKFLWPGSNCLLVIHPVQCSFFGTIDKLFDSMIGKSKLRTSTSAFGNWNSHKRSRNDSKNFMTTVTALAWLITLLKFVFLNSYFIAFPTQLIGIKYRILWELLTHCFIKG